MEYSSDIDATFRKIYYEKTEVDDRKNVETTVFECDYPPVLLHEYRYFIVHRVTRLGFEQETLVTNGYFDEDTAKVIRAAILEHDKRAEALKG